MRLTYVVPPGWRRAEATGELDLLRPAHDRGWFRTNVVIAADRVPPRDAMEAHLASALARLHARHADVEVLGDAPVALAAGSGRARVVAFDVERPAVRVAQVQVLLAREDDGVAAPSGCDVVATCAFDELEQHAWAFTEMIRSLAWARDER